MRRPVIYLAGLLLATGASFALAAPASAAPANDHGSWSSNSVYEENEQNIWDAEHNVDQNTSYQNNGISLLSGNSSILGGILGGVLG
jgi:hypothetical protein